MVREFGFDKLFTVNEKDPDFMLDDINARDRRISK